jgi:3-methylfumaryl-CoA hydratase
MADAPRPEDWIGRQETLFDTADGAMIDRLNAALDRDDPRLQPGDPLPPLAHWCLFLPVVRASETGPDGHPARGGFLPPVHHLPRRMWAGSRLWFPGDIAAGMLIQKTSTILSVKEREGATGPLIFVTVRHEITQAGGGPLLVADEHDIVYRSIEATAAKPAPPAPEGAVWRRELVPDPVLLFRYSAVTFNGHRIHYDRSYVTQVEGYPGLVVHGPLTATLMMDLVRRSLPQARIRRF